MERFEFFVTTNEVPDATKKCLFLSSVGPECFQKIKSQVKPQTLADRTFAQIVAAGEAIYKQQLTVIGRRNLFMGRNRKSSETVAQYALALRELCGDCEYPAVIQTEILCDVFVKGLQLPTVQAKLLLRDNTLTFDLAYKTALAEELARKCSEDFNVPHGNVTAAAANLVEDVNHVGKRFPHPGKNHQGEAKPHPVQVQISSKIKNSKEISCVISVMASTTPQSVIT